MGCTCVRGTQPWVDSSLHADCSAPGRGGCVSATRSEDYHIPCMVTTDSPMPDAMLVFQDVQQRHLINHRSTACMLPDFSEPTYACVICVNAFEYVASFTCT